MLHRIEQKSIFQNYLSVLVISMVTAGAIVTTWQSVKTFLDFQIYFLTSFVGFELLAILLIYLKYKEKYAGKIFLAFILIPFFMIVFTVFIAILSEMFYGGSGYHGERYFF